MSPRRSELAIPGITETVTIEGVAGSFQVYLGRGKPHFRICYNEAPTARTYRSSRARAEALSIAVSIRETGVDPRPPRSSNHALKEA